MTSTGGSVGRAWLAAERQHALSHGLVEQPLLGAKEDGATWAEGSAARLVGVKGAFGREGRVFLADMVKAYKEEDSSREEARARLLDTFNQLAALGVPFTQELIDKNMAEFDAIW